MYTWRRKACLSHSKSSWNKVKDLMADTDRSDKNFVLAERAETLLFCLKQRYPELSQTSLDTCKIQYNQVSLAMSIYSRGKVLAIHFLTHSMIECMWVLLNNGDLIPYLVGLIPKIVKNWNLYEFQPITKSVLERMCQRVCVANISHIFISCTTNNIEK